MNAFPQSDTTGHAPSCPAECDCCQETWVAAVLLAEQAVVAELWRDGQPLTAAEAARRSTAALRKMRLWYLES